MRAIDRQRRLTDIGRRMVPFPLSPPLARMVIEAADRFPDVVDDVLVVGAFLSGRSPFLYPLGQEADARAAQRSLKHSTGDAVTNLKTYRAWQRAKDPGAYCQRHFLDADIMGFIDKSREQLAEIATAQGITVSGGGDISRVNRCVAAAFADRLLLRDGRFYHTRNGARIGIHPSSALFRSNETVVVAAELVSSGRTWARHCSVVQLPWLDEIDPDLAVAVRGGRRGRRHGKPKKGGRPPKPSHESIRIGQVSLRIDRSRKRARVTIPIEHVPALAEASGQFLDRHDADLMASIATVDGKLGRGTRLGELLRLLPFLPVPKPSERLPREKLDGAILHAHDNWATIRSQLGRLLSPMRPNRGRRLGWLALVGTGTGEFWFEVVTDFHAALQTNALSLEDLADRVDTPDAQAVAAHRDRVNSLLERVSQAG